MDSLPPKIEALVRAIDASRPTQPAHAAALLRTAGLTAADLDSWARPHHDLRDSYGRVMIAERHGFELMCMTWDAGDCSAIHDHGFTQWGSVAILGPAEHAVFVREGQTVRTLSRERVSPGTVVEVDHDLIHQMANPTSTRFLTLHLYGAMGMDTGITAGARLYELDEGRLYTTDGGVFFGLGAPDYSGDLGPIQSDVPTTLRHRIELLTRLVKAGAPQATLRALLGRLTLPLERGHAAIEMRALPVRGRAAYAALLHTELAALGRHSALWCAAGLLPQPIQPEVRFRESVGLAKVLASPTPA